MAAIHSCVAVTSPIYHRSSNRAFYQRRFKTSNSSRVVSCRAAVDTARADGPLEDYYSILGLQPDATAEEIKKAYYACMRVCHPDLIGDEVGATNFCMFVNEVYEVLSNPDQRMLYDELNGFSLASVNPFQDEKSTKDRVFVDEFSCIGCKNCSHTAPCAFAMEEDFGRARVISQSGDPSLIQTAVETCPVDCIHWVSSRQLALLEDEMRGVERVNVGVMLSGMGHQSPDVFEVARSRWDKKQKLSRERAKDRIMRENGMGFTVPWWQAMWSPTEGYGRQDSEATERATRTAAAATRWRQYSRGVHNGPMPELPQNVEKQQGEDN